MKKVKSRSGRVFCFPIGHTIWFLVSLEDQDELQKLSLVPKTRNGLIPITVTIGSSSWNTSLLPYKHIFLIPIKKEIRRREKIQEGDIITYTYTLVNN